MTNFNGDWLCNTCSNQYLITIDQTKRVNSHCAPITLIPYCIEYNNELTIDASNYECTECDSSYYLMDNKCHPRVYYPENCETYSLYHDFCVECYSGFYLTNSKICEAYP